MANGLLDLGLEVRMLCQDPELQARHTNDAQCQKGFSDVR